VGVSSAFFELRIISKFLNDLLIETKATVFPFSQKIKLMNWIIFPLLLLVIFALNNPTEKEAPPGTIKLRKNLYIDKTPVTNIDWQEYLYCLWIGEIETNMVIPYLNHDNKCAFVYNSIYEKKAQELLKSNEYVEFSLDSINVGKKEKWTKYKKTVGISNNGNSYFPIHYPVLDVDLDEARDYCAWRSNTVMFYYASQKKRKRNKLFTSIKYRVPTNQELTMAKQLYPSKSDRAFYIVEPGVDLNYLNGTFEEWTMDKPIQASNFWSKKRMGFRCICEVIEE
jgi:hypothetical protein